MHKFESAAAPMRRKTQVRRGEECRTLPRAQEKRQPSVIEMQASLTFSMTEAAPMVLSSWAEAHLSRSEEPALSRMPKGSHACQNRGEVQPSRSPAIIR
jgi:hypothetical protein